MFDATHKNNVAIDIETTGFAADGAVTVFGMVYETDQTRCANVALNTGGRSVDTDQIQSSVEKASNIRVDLTAFVDESGLLDQVGTLIFDCVDREYDRLVAYNGETWRGGFDIPYLRSRCTRQGIDWALHKCDFKDLYPVVSKRFHTSLPDEDGNLESHNDLVRAHRFLCDPENEFDPYESSEKAVVDYSNGEFTRLVQHNVSDIVRTLDLAEVAEQYASPKQMQTDRL